MNLNNQDGIKFVNLIQSACSRPKLYTENAEVYAMFIGFEIGSKGQKDADRFAVCETLQWMWNSVPDRTQVVSEFLVQYGSDVAVLTAIEAFASTLPPT